MHSFIRGSIEKLNEFVQRVSPEVIIPSVYNDGPDSAAAMAIKLTAAQMCNKRLVGYRLSRGDNIVEVKNIDDLLYPPCKVKMKTDRLAPNHSHSLTQEHHVSCTRIKFPC
ncbi:unnamed protein product [Brassica oleracea]|uniref:(rape) hypothetical protein n=1 Tax=Brassica napus TaxID=3708 RepID=A0A816V4N3_BRANA|nr:unnamed protein product [Brassica napus]